MATQPADSSQPSFTAAQQALLDAIAAGASKAAAAQAANVHRDTANHWTHQVPGFSEAVLSAQQEYRQRLASQLRRISATAVDQLEALLAAPETPPSVRLRAIQLTLTRPRFPDKEWALPENISSPEVQRLQDQFAVFEAEYRASLQEDHLRREQVRTEKILRESTPSETSTAGTSAASPQPAGCPKPEPAPPSDAAHQTENNVGNVGFVGSSNSKTEGESPDELQNQTPRSAPCPCGSGQKYKRCCGRNAPPHLHTARAA